MITIKELAQKLQEKLDNIEVNTLFKFNVVTDTGEFRKPEWNGEQLTEYVNCLFTSQNSDISTLQTNSLVVTQTCALSLVLRMTGREETTYYDNGELIAYGDIDRVTLLREYLESVLQFNGTETMTDNDGKEYIVSIVYELLQSGSRGQVDRVGDAYTFNALIYYTFVQNGINSQQAVFMLDGEQIPYQSVTTFRTPTMDGNVYANTTDGATKNLASQSTFSFSFELPALKDKTTNNMLDYMLNGDINQAHLLKYSIGDKVKEYLVTYGEIKTIGETIKNVGQTLTLVECPNDYDLISFGEYVNIYEVTTAFTLNIDSKTQAYVFGADGNRFVKSGDSVKVGDKIVITEILTENVGVIQEWNKEITQ